MKNSPYSNMKQILLICAVVALVGCHAGNKKNASKAKAIAEAKAAAEAEAKRQSTIVEIADPIVEKAIRDQLKKPTGELTKADLEEVTYLSLKNNQLTEVPKGLEKCAKLKKLILFNNRLTDVSALANLTQLEWLFLDFNQLTDVQGLEKLPQLTGLNIDFNKLTEVPKGLEKLTQLEKLSVKSNFDLTKAQIAELQKALPNCTIHSNPTK